MKLSCRRPQPSQSRAITFTLFLCKEKYETFTLAACVMAVLLSSALAFGQTGGIRCDYNSPFCTETFKHYSDFTWKYTGHDEPSLLF